MIERLGLTTMSDLESALRDLGSAVEMPPTPELAGIVGDRLRAMATAGPMPSPKAPATMEPRRLPVIRSVRRSLLLAAAIAILVVSAALGVRFGLDLLEIDFGPVPSISAPPASVASPGASARPTPRIDAGAMLSLGLVSTLDEAAADADFPVLVPDVLGPPDEVYGGGPSLRGQVAFGYRPRADLPEQDLLAGLGLLITQNRGEFDQGLVRKLIDMELGIVVPVDVDGAPGFWMAGEPHVFWYLAPDGTIIQESERRAGDTLAWERDGILYRIEGAASKERALEIARSMRTP